MVLLTPLIIACMITCSCSRKLIQANVVFRHGDRSAIHMYPTDKHQASAWPEGLGMLTQIGKEQQTRLGIFLRKRYKNFIGLEFDSKEIYVRSSDFDRTLLSVYSNLAGLYAHNGSVNWTGEFVRWQPVPVHTVPVLQDEVLSMERPCAKFTKLVRELVDGKMDTLNADFSALMSVLTEQTGFSDSQSKILPIRDTLFCERAHGMDWPVWATWRNTSCVSSPLVPCHNRTIFDILTDLYRYGYVFRSEAKPLRKFHGGPLVMEVLDNFRKILEDSAGTPQLNIFSAHDSTVGAVLSALSAFDGSLPQYASAVLIELYTGAKDGEYLVEVYYKNVTDHDEVWKLDLTDCPSPCTLKQFNNTFQSLRIDDWEKACTLNRGLDMVKVEVISICAAMVVCMGLATLICYMKRERKPFRYTPAESAAEPLL